MENLNITLIQTALFWEDPPKNLDHFRKLIDGIKEQSDLILLPEMFNTGFSINPEFCGEPMDGPSMLFLREMAKSKQGLVNKSNFEVKTNSPCKKLKKSWFCLLTFIKKS